MSRVKTALYGVGFHHESGETSVVCLTGGTCRLVVGELAASAADALEAARGRRPLRG